MKKKYLSHQSLPGEGKNKATNTRVAMILLTLGAFALHFYRLAYPSLRGDEAFDVLFASQSLGEVLYQLRFVQPYPPLFHTGLHFWLPVAGPSEVAVRFWAVLCATMVVPTIYVLGSLLFSKQVGLTSALLAAVNPFIHWWGQDAHFYAQLIALTALLNVVALRFWRTGEHPQNSLKGQDRKQAVVIGGLYVLIALLSFLTHYFAYFTWGALNLVAIVQSLRRRWPRQLVRRWWSAQIVLIILYLPWVILSTPVTSTFVQPWIELVTLWEMLWRDLVAFSLGYVPRFPPGEGRGYSVSGATFPWLAGFFVALFVAGIVLGWMRRAYRRGLILMLTLIFVPLLVIYLASFYRPMFDEKLTIFLLPIYLVILSVGIVELVRRWRWVGWAVGLTTILIMSIANYQYYANETFAKSPAWREMVDYVNSKAQPGDLLVYNLPEPSILYYNDGKLPTELIPNSAELSAEEIGAHLEQAVEGHTRVWLVPLVRPWWDARGDVLTWLDRHADRVDQRFFQGVHVNLYLTPSAWQSEMTPQPVTFDKGVRLRGFRLSGGDDVAPNPMLSAGDALHLSLYWQADAPTDVSYTIFTHLVGPDGQLYGQWDNPPVWGTYPTTDWLPGENVVDRYEIPVNPDAPPGHYRLLVGVYDPSTGARLPVINDLGEPIGDHMRLEQEITIR